MLKTSASVVLAPMGFRFPLWLSIIFPLLFSAVLGYGYWHVHTHGSLYVSLYDSSLGRYGESVKEGVIELFDSSGRKLITLTADGLYGAYLITDPAPYDCRPQERTASHDTLAQEAWQTCFQRQSRWVAEVAPSIAWAVIRFNRCELRNVPVSLSANYSDWFLWWVPLPHIGGNPYASFSQTFYVDGRSCLAAHISPAEIPR